MDQPPSSKEPRGPVSLRIKFRSASLDQFIERYAVDVSRGGIFIRTREPLPVGTQLRFDFQLQDAGPLLAGEGTVVWIRENDPNRAGVTPGMGVRFDKVSPATQPTLERILAEKARREQEGAPAKPGPAGGMAVRRPSSTFSALDPGRGGQPPAPPRVGGLSPLAPGAAPRAPQPGTGSGPLRTGAAPRAAQPGTGSGPLGTRAKTSENPVPQGIPTLESSGAFGRRTNTSMNAQRNVPVSSALFEKPSAEDIDRALSVLTEVDGPAPEPMPEPVDFSARFRRPTEPQMTVPESAPTPPAPPPVVSTTAAAASIPSDLMRTVRRPTDAQPLVVESMPDVGDAPGRRGGGTRPFVTGGTSEQKLPTVPVFPLGASAGTEAEAPYDEEEEDGQTTAWQNSGPTKVGETSPELAAYTGSGDDLPKAAPPPPQPPVMAKPPAMSLDKPPTPPRTKTPAPGTLPSAAMAAPSAPPAVMRPDFAAPPPKKKSSAPAVVIVLLLAAGGAGAFIYMKGGIKPATPPSGATPAASGEPEPGASAGPNAVAPNPEQAAGGGAGAGATPAGDNKGGEAAKPAAAKPDEAKPGNTKPMPSADKNEGATSGTLRAHPLGPPVEPPKDATGKPADDKAASKEGGGSHRSRRRGGGAAAEAPPAETKPAEGAAAVADVSPGAGDTAAPSGEAPKAGSALKITSSPAGAEVIIDGNSVGKTPYLGSDVDPNAPHSITLKKDGFEDHERMISGSDWPRAKGGVRTLKVNVKLHSTGGGEAKPAEAAPESGEPAPGLGTTPTTPKRE